VFVSVAREAGGALFAEGSETFVEVGAVRMDFAGQQLQAQGSVYGLLQAIVDQRFHAAQT
jgi:hypothetical protein